MNLDSSQPMETVTSPKYRLVVTSTFTAEPIEDALSYWMDELGIRGTIEFAPYNQVFQQLLDPSSQLAQNWHGVNVVLVRVEDWLRFDGGPESAETSFDRLTSYAFELIDAVRAAQARSPTPLIVGLCPNSAEIASDQMAQHEVARVEDQITSTLGEIPGLYLIARDDFRAFPVIFYDDPERDRLGHIPYTPLFFAALATTVARRIYSLLTPPRKVIVLDCDQTLWKGIVGEDGTAGITIPPAFQQLQQWMTELSSKGFLLCLCSKNEEADVLAVFDQRSDMVLKRKHLVSWRINWELKSRNMQSMAEELNLGLDSFIFLDDNPIECAQVRADCPEVLTLQLPSEDQLANFVSNVWAFDRFRVTSEDRQRTALYQEEANRSRFRKQAATIEEFLGGLSLQVTISEPTPTQLPRIAQLTQRTNQFNFTTIRRTETEIQQLAVLGLQCRTVTVSDRFGDYGLVGVLIFGEHGDSLLIDTFLLSCRVLGRGVEYQMLRALGQLAHARCLSRVVATLVSTPKNMPARRFLEDVAHAYRTELTENWRYDIPAEVVVNLAYTPQSAQPTLEFPPSNESSPAVARANDRQSSWQRIERIASVLSLPDQVLQATHTRLHGRRSRVEWNTHSVPPRTEMERALARLWCDVLLLDYVSAEDNFFDLGGTSLRAVDLFAQIEHRFGKRLPLTAVLEAPTVAQLARLLTEARDRDSLVLIRDGSGRPPLFLVHDGDGETMLYRNLALRLKPDHAVFGLQPCSRGNAPCVHTRVEEMAAHHIDRMRSVQPDGPYLVGGMCAGGVIAYEIGCQLQRQGAEVALVGLLDAADVTVPLKAWRFASQRLQSFSSVFQQDKPRRFDQRILSVGVKALRKARNLGSYLIRHGLTSLRDDFQMRLLRAYVDHDCSLPSWLQGIPVRTVYLFAENHYRPSRPFNGRLVLFRATAGDGADEPYIERYSDPLLGWAQRATKGVQVYDASGGHSSMLQEPHVQTLAEQMQLVIDEALEPSANSSHELSLMSGRSQSDLASVTP
jgi:FkbH-like protein